jgi:hypothetical protein
MITFKPEAAVTEAAKEAVMPIKKEAPAQTPTPATETVPTP